jgi:hypothetical protein
MRKGMKRILGLGALAAAGYAIWRAFDARKIDTGVTWQPQPFPYPPAPAARADPLAPGEAAAPDTAAPVEPEPSPWVDPDDGACPTTHPVKAKLTSGIFHVPGGANYERTKADRCYTTTDAAEADGLRASKV